MRTCFKMSTYGRAILLGAALLVIAGCSGPNRELPMRSPSLSPLAGSDIAGLSLVDRGSALELTFATVTADGVFAHVDLPDGRRLDGVQLLSSPEHIGLAAPAGGGFDVGVVGLSELAGQPVTIELPVSAVGRLVSVPPVGAYNVISDLAVTSAGDGLVELSWTQTNTGDYDFDGLVGISDLTPIGQLLGLEYDRAAPDAAAQRTYWVDGNADGEITVSDITPIGQNYGSYIAGYMVKHNGVPLQDTAPGEPTVPRSAGQPREGLPPLYSAVLPGSPADDWAVVAVDKDGVEGSGSGDIIGDISLRANLDLSGLDLFDLNGTNPGPYAPSKGGSRLIEPVEIIGSERWEVPHLPLATRTMGCATVFLGAPREQLLYLDIFYLPTVDLITGDSRPVSSTRAVSTASAEHYTISSVPVRLPAFGTTDLDIAIEFSPNPDGGYFTMLTVDSLMPGDNPATPEIEDGYALKTRNRLAHATGLVSTDTDLDGDFGDEAELLDSDRDGISDVRLEHDAALSSGDLVSCGELEIEGELLAFAEHTGVVTLGGAVLIEDGETELPDPLVIVTSELTRYEEHVKTDEGLIRRDVDPSSLEPGDTIEVTMICLEDPDELLPDKYWVEKLMRKLDERTK